MPRKSSDRNSFILHKLPSFYERVQRQWIPWRDGYLSVTLAVPRTPLQVNLGSILLRLAGFLNRFSNVLAVIIHNNIVTGVSPQMLPWQRPLFKNVRSLRLCVIIVAAEKCGFDDFAVMINTGNLLLVCLCLLYR